MRGIHFCNIDWGWGGSVGGTRGCALSRANDVVTRWVLSNFSFHKFMEDDDCMMNEVGWSVEKNM